MSSASFLPLLLSSSPNRLFFLFLLFLSSPFLSTLPLSLTLVHSADLIYPTSSRILGLYPEGTISLNSNNNFLPIVNSTNLPNSLPECTKSLQLATPSSHQSDSLPFKSSNDVLFIVLSFNSPLISTLDSDPNAPTPCSPSLLLNTPNLLSFTSSPARALFVPFTDPLYNATNLFPNELLFVYRVRSIDCAVRLDFAMENSSNQQSFNFEGCLIQGNINLQQQIQSFLGRKQSIEQVALTINPTIHIKPSLSSLPTIVALRVPPQLANQKLRYGQSLELNVEFSYPIRLITEGKPQPSLLLNSGGRANYFSLLNPNTLSFRYQVGEGEESDRLDVLQFVLNGSLVLDYYSGNRVNLIFPTGSTAGSLYQSNIEVIRFGLKFPPINYRATELPINSTVNGKIPVKVLPQISAVLSVKAADQSAQFDFNQLVEFKDDRFALTHFPDLTINEYNQMWNPALGFINNRENTDNINAADSKLTINSDGTVQLFVHYIVTFETNFDFRDFPWDTQRLYIDLHSINPQTNSLIAWTPLSSNEVNEINNLLSSIQDASFTYSNFHQEVVNDKFNQNVLRSSFSAKRLSTYNSTTVILPLCLIIILLVFTLFLPKTVMGRVNRPIALLHATLTFSFVLAKQNPPVNYLTRMIKLLLFTYACCMITLLAQLLMSYIRSIKFNKINESNEEGSDKDKKKKQSKSMGRSSQLNSRNASLTLNPILVQQSDSRAYVEMVDFPKNFTKEESENGAEKDKDKDKDSSAEGGKIVSFSSLFQVNPFTFSSSHRNRYLFGFITVRRVEDKQFLWFLMDQFNFYFGCIFVALVAIAAPLLLFA